ncbi:MAG TPA: hypothetical protein VMG11_01445 [Steroidobacteraceae bacterium]|nr:hypothetical protein [Steroidobacteraceae bacterium]
MFKDLSGRVLVSGAGVAGIFRVLLAVAPLLAYADSAPPAPPEVKKTVDAFAGHWTLTGTDREPGNTTAAAVNGTMDCKSAALNAAVSCLIAADVSGSRVEAATVIGYSPDEHLVRWMEISSTGEYHDHHGRWNGNRIEFEPLTYAVAGERMTEYFSLSFVSDHQMIWKATTKMREGESRLELSATRAGAKAP